MKHMKFELVEIVTKDKLVHQGIYYSPKNPGHKLTSTKAPAGRAILWVHGLTGRFYGDVTLMNLFAKYCSKQGVGFASFNTRGHDVIASISTIDPSDPSGQGHRMIGAGYESFKECVFDIDAAVSFLVSKGFSEVIIVGHSTGANKACYYAATQKDGCVSGVVLAGPISDRCSPQTDKEAYKHNLTTITSLRSEGKGEALLTNVSWFPATADRAFSLIAPNTEEDVFNYGDTANVLSLYAKITKPMLVVFSGNDEYADRPITTIRQVFDTHTKSQKYQSVVIADTTHGYEGKESEFVSVVVGWVTSLT